jgi:hypothetical protein
LGWGRDCGIKVESYGSIPQPHPNPLKRGWDGEGSVFAPFGANFQRVYKKPTESIKIKREQKGKKKTRKSEKIYDKHRKTSYRSCTKKKDD